MKEEEQRGFKRFSSGFGHASQTGVSQGYARRQGVVGGVVVWERGSRKRGERKLVSRWWAVLWYELRREKKADMTVSSGKN